MAKTKLRKSWITTHTRADGSKFYTAHIKVLSFRLFWLIPIYREEAIVQYAGKVMFYDEDTFPVYEFTSYLEAEKKLVEMIEAYIEDEVQIRSSKVVKSKKEEKNLDKYLKK